MVERPIGASRPESRRAWSRPPLGVRAPRLVAMTRAQETETVEALADLILELVEPDGEGEAGQ